MEWDFDFCAANISEEDAKKLMELISVYVELCHGQVGGGFAEHKEEAADEAS